MTTLVSGILTTNPLRRAPYLMQENLRAPGCVTSLNSKPPCFKNKDTKKMETKLWIYFLKFDEKPHSSLSNLRPAGQPGMWPAGHEFDMLGTHKPTCSLPISCKNSETGKHLLNLLNFLGSVWLDPGLFRGRHTPPSPSSTTYSTPPRAPPPPPARIQ